MLKYAPISPPDGWTKFQTPAEKLAYLKENSLTPKTFETPKIVWYQGVYTDVPARCEVVGFASPVCAVIELYGQLHCIDVRHLVEMQKGQAENSRQQAERDAAEAEAVSAESARVRYCVFDVETPNGRNDRISSIGIALVEDDTVVEQYSSLVNPETEFWPKNTEITGISQKDVADAPLFPEIWEQVKNWFAGSVIVAHNAKFDLTVLSKTMAAYGIEHQPWNYLCTLKLAKGVYPELNCHKLDALCEHFEIPLQHHQASSDSLACARLLFQMRRDGAQVDDSITEFGMAEETTQSAPVPHRSAASEAMDELTGLLRLATVDEVMPLDEADNLRSWLTAHQCLEDDYPFDRALPALYAALSDGVLSERERSQLLSLFDSLSDPLAHTFDQCGKIDLTGRAVCISGDFDFGGRKEVEARLSQMGAVIKTSVSKKLDYLLVGSIASTAWSNGKYGSKIKRALELQGQGYRVQVIRENDVFTAPEKDKVSI